MGFLDKLKPQPRWKHADPAVRLEALRDLDDPTELGALSRIRPGRPSAASRGRSRGRRRRARTNRGVRRRSAKRASARSIGWSPSRVASTDRPRRRRRVTTRRPTALAAVRQIADPRRLSTIAKSEASEAVSRRGARPDHRRARAQQHRASGQARDHGRRALARLTDSPSSSRSRCTPTSPTSRRGVRSRGRRPRRISPAPLDRIAHASRRPSRAGRGR